MNWKTKANALTWLPVGLGGLALSLATVMASTRDEQGLYIQPNPTHVVLWLLTALAIGAIAWLSASFPGKLRYERLFPASLPAAVGIALGGCALLIHGGGELLKAQEWMGYVSAGMGILCAPVVWLLAWFRYQGRKPHYLLRCLITVYLMVHLLLSQYRQWCGESQLMGYAFPLLASVATVLACYERTAFEVNLGSRPRYLLLSRCALFLCLAAIPCTDQKIFYLGMACWLGTDLCSLRPVRRRTPAGAEG